MGFRRMWQKGPGWFKVEWAGRLQVTLALLGLGWLLAACARSTPTPTPTLTPTPPTFVVVVRPPDLTPWDADLQRCARAEDIPLVVHEVAKRALSTVEADVYLVWGDPPAQAYAYALGEEAVWAVTSGTNPVRDLTPAQVRRLFMGWVTDWHDLGGLVQAVRLWVPDEDDMAYPVLEETLLGVPPSTQAKVAPEPRAMLEALAKAPGGAGWLPARWLTPADLPPKAATWAAKVHVLSADPLARMPVIAFTWQEPEGPVRALLACLQGSSTDE